MDVQTADLCLESLVQHGSSTGWMLGNSGQKWGRRGGPGHRGKPCWQTVEGGQLPRRRINMSQIKEMLFTWGMWCYWYIFNRLRHKCLLSTSISPTPLMYSRWLGSGFGRSHQSVSDLMYKAHCLEHSTQPIKEKWKIKLAEEQTQWQQCFPWGKLGVFTNVALGQSLI